MLYHSETSGFVGAPAASVFAYTHDSARLASHMSKSSWMMGGGRMETELDAGRGQVVGSRIRLSGRVSGIQPFRRRGRKRAAPSAAESVGDDRLSQTLGDWALSDGVRDRAGADRFAAPRLHRL
jgi:hypothetical protein